jgi:N-acetylglucosamine-6-phosphate deacetylase
VGLELLSNCVLLDPELDDAQPGRLLLEDGRIAARLAAGEPDPERARPVDMGGMAVAPGLLDLHFHGATVFSPPDDALAELRHDAVVSARHGTTAFLATTVCGPPAELAHRVTSLVRAVASPPGDGAIPLGIHLEGPWIAPGAVGAQPPEGIRQFDPDEGAALFARGEGLIRMVTLAPERDGADRLLDELARRGIVAAIGHSLAAAEDVEAAVGRGARHVTHLFNAMGPVHHRAPGVAGAALADDRLSCDLICDGVHVDPRLVRVASRAKGAGLVLITDRIDPAAADGGRAFGGRPILEKDGALRLADGRLAGSCLTLERALANARAFAAMTRTEALAACTLRPARLLGIEAERGTLRVGARADLVVLDAEDRVVETWIGGRRVYGRSGGAPEG